MIKRTYEYVKDKAQRYVLPFLKAWAAAAGVPVFSLIIQLLDSAGVPAVSGLDTPLAQAFFTTVLVYVVPNISQE